MSFEVTEEERRELEYATQFFGFTPDSFVDTVSFTTTDILEEELNKFQNRVAEEFSGKLSSKELDVCFKNAKEQVYKMIQMYNDLAVKIMNRLGEYLKKNIFRIPKEVVLPEDKVHAERKFNSDDLENSLKTLDNLCTKISTAKYKKAVLQAKLTNLQKVAAQQEKLLAEVNELESQRHQMEALYDQQEKILEEKLKSMQPLMQKLENNVTSDSGVVIVVSNHDDDVPPKRRLELEKFIVDKKFRFDVDDDDDDDGDER